MQVKTIDRNGVEKMMEERYAKILAKMGRLTYMTRDMVAAPVKEVEPSEELDSAGTPWNADLHVASKLQNKDGTWRKKPGAAAVEVVE